MRVPGHIFRLCGGAVPRLIVACVVLEGTCTVAFCDAAGTDLVVKACRQSGYNSGVIRSCFLEFSLVSETVKSDARYREDAAKRKDALLKAMKGHQSPEKNLAALEKAIRANELTPREIKGSCLYRADVSGLRKTRYSLRYRDVSSGVWSNPLLTLSETGDLRIVSVVLDDDLRVASVSPKGSDITGFYLAGRMQGSLIHDAIYASPNDPTGKSREQAIQKFVEQRSFRATGKAGYDDGSEAIVVESSKNGHVVQRFWIDPSKDYICPSIQTFDENSGQPLEEYTSKNYVLHPGTGLWFPTSYSVIRYAPETGDVVLKQGFTITATTLKLNQDVSDGEFTLDVAENHSVDDARSSPLIRYRAIANGSLSLGTGGLGLEHMKWLQQELPPGEYTPPQGGASGVARILLMVVGILLIAWALVLKFKSRKTGAAMLLLALLVPFGCSRSAPPGEPFTITPSVLDFGKVRPTDSPVALEFALRNDGDRPLRILDVVSGCGCTVLECPERPIPPGTEVRIPLKIDVRGRSGDFANSVLIKTDAVPESSLISVKGKVVADIWFNGQALRCTAEPGRPATVIFELHTVDYPEIAFDLSKIDPRIRIDEMSRTTTNGETTIKFSLEIAAQDDEASLALNLVPVDETVAPVLIPVYRFQPESS